MVSLGLASTRIRFCFHPLPLHPTTHSSQPLLSITQHHPSSHLFFLSTPYIHSSNPFLSLSLRSSAPSPSSSISSSPSSVAILSQDSMAEAVGKKRRKRPTTTNFKAAELVESWKERTNLRDPGFQWDGSGYGKPSRSSGIDEESISTYAKPLKVLLTLAPTGFPSHPDLRRAFVILNQRFNALQVSQRQEEKAASEAADKWRIMCRDVYNATKKKNKEGYSDAMTELIALIHHPGPDGDEIDNDCNEEEETPAEAGTGAADATGKPTSHSRSISRWWPYHSRPHEG